MLSSMCRFVMYLGPEITLSSLITEPSHSLIRQSTHSRERSEPMNGDGFGVAWFRREVDPHPGVFRSVSPAWSNRNLRSLARVTRSPCVMAHVRAASPDIPVSEINCHPFAARGYAFMHNGDIGGFRRVRRDFVAAISDDAYAEVEGTTDSEHVFGLFLDRVAADPPKDAGALADALADTVASVMDLAARRSMTDPIYLNLAVSDGVRAAAVRFTNLADQDPATLYVHTGARYTCQGGVCHMVHPEAGRNAVIVSSEPLSDDPGWRRVRKNHVLAISDGRVEERPLSAAVG
jgi:glutamine amidotransferase